MTKYEAILYHAGKEKCRFRETSMEKAAVKEEHFFHMKICRATFKYMPIRMFSDTVKGMAQGEKIIRNLNHVLPKNFSRQYPRAVASKEIKIPKSIIFC